MPLPESKAAWPPASETGRYSRMSVNSTWYAGDPAALATLYDDSASGAKHRSAIRYAVDTVRSWFWGASDKSQPDDKRHLPVAQDIATLSADTLFGEEVQFEVQPDPTWARSEDGELSKAQQDIIDKAQARLDEILSDIDFTSTLLAAAETAAPLGSVALRIAYDKRLGSTHPTISRVDADHVVAEYEWGNLIAVTFWEVVASDGEILTYHLERHEPGVIFHGLYRGTRGNLGQQLPLTEHSSTAPYAPLVDENGAILTGVEGLAAVSIPNMLPDPADRGNENGRPDYTASVLNLFDDCDRIWTSLMRDITDGRSRLIVSRGALNTKGAGKGVEFDEDQHIFTELNTPPREDGGAPIEQIQFQIRVDEHLKALDKALALVIQACGYNADTDTGENGRDMTATEFNGRSKRTMRTRDKKLRYWRRIERLMRTMLELDAAHFGSGIVPLPVKMIVPDVMQPSLLDLATTAKMMRDAKAASTRTIVESLHPDWTPDMIEEEVALIDGADEAADPTLVGLPGSVNAPGAPLPDEDPATDDAAV